MVVGQLAKSSTGFWKARLLTQSGRPTNPPQRHHLLQCRARKVSRKRDAASSRLISSTVCVRRRAEGSDALGASLAKASPPAADPESPPVIGRSSSQIRAE